MSFLKIQSSEASPNSVTAPSVSLTGVSNRIQLCAAIGKGLVLVAAFLCEHPQGSVISFITY